MLVFRSLELQSLWLFPCEALVSEVTVLGSLTVNWVDEVELLDDETWSHVKVVSNNLDKLF